MITIELTEAQRQALQAAPGQPVAVVDPFSQRHYLLIPQEQTGNGQLLPLDRASMPSRTPGPSDCVPEVKPLRDRVRDHSLPPEVAALAKRFAKRFSYWGSSRREAEDYVRLQYFYGGKWIAYLRSAEGPIVVAAADCHGDPRFDQQLSFLSPEERRSSLLDRPEPLFSEESNI
jgi:hypothetical protein